VKELTPLRMTVLGSGSVGLAIAPSFARAGQSVSLLARRSALPLLRKYGITVTGVCGDHRIGPNRLRASDAGEPDPQDIACDVLIVATKSCQVADVLKRSTRKAGAAVAPKAVLLLQNGWGSADEACAALPAEVPVFSRIMVIGIDRRNPTHVNVNVQASPIRLGTLFGAAPEGMKDTVARGQAGFLPITCEDEIEPVILNKFLFNTCLSRAVVRMGQGRGTPTPANDAVASLVRTREA
jgi:2-dehydropantoate 2-reductase